MGGDYNKNGDQYQAASSAHEDRSFGVLNNETRVFYDLINNIILNKYKKSKDENDLSKISLYKNMNSCMSCLDGFLYQCSKLSYHNNEIFKQIPEQDITDTMACFSSIETCTDFESLLYQGRATLDRLTFFISKQIYDSETDKFNKLENVLGNFEKRDERARKSINIIKSSIGYFQGLLINDYSGKTSLRSLLAHSKSHEEAINGAFTIHRSNNGVLIFDQEINNFPMIISSNILNRYVPFLILNILAIYLEVDGIGEEKVSSSWNPICINSSEYRIEEGDVDGVDFSVIVLNPIGFTINTYTFHKNILEKVLMLKD
jgi:hypothetical protein